MWSAGSQLRDGVIDVDVRRRDVYQKSFLGIASHIASDTAFDVVYLRPFNFRATDPTRHGHAVQYAAFHECPWERLRGDRPRQYESALPADGDPEAWHHLQLVIRAGQLAVTVDRAATPALRAQLLGPRTEGGVGLWIGDLAPGDFANLTDRPDA